MSDKPKKWIATLLGFFIQPIGMMYVGQMRWAGIYLLIGLALGVVGEFYLHRTEIAAGAMQILVALACAVHAFRLAAKYPDDKPRPAYSRWYALLGAGFILFSVVFGVRAFLVEPFRSPAGSMLPAIPLRAHMIVQKWGYGNYGTYGLNLFRTPITAPLRRGDIIVFEYPPDRSLHYVKRLIGLPGDKIAYRGKRLFLNDVPVPQRRAGDYFNPQFLSFTPTFMESLAGTEYAILFDDSSPAAGPEPRAFPFDDKCAHDAFGITCHVPPGHYFTLGDNRDHSADSRMWGFVPADHVVGKVLYILP